MKTFKSAFLLLVIPGLFSCYNSSEDIFLEDLDIVVTSYDDNYDFGPAQTFVLPDSVVRITGDDDDSDDDDEGQFDELILDRVRQNLLDLGYTEEPDPENNPSDLVIVVQTLVIDNYVITDPYFFWRYWGWYPWFPDYGYGPGYGWYYPFPIVVGRYTSGTIFINMFDPQQTGTRDEEIPNVWLGALNGVLEGSTSGMQARITRGIDQAFDQSPYLAN